MTTVLGFTVLSYGSSLLGTYTIPGSNVSLTMRRETAPLLLAYGRDFNAQVETLKKGSCWGFDPKHIEGSATWSNHAWGGALDFNAPAHPMGKSGTFSAAKVRTIHSLLAKYTYKGTRLLRWGGDYTGRKDEMHIEINVTRNIALAAVAAMSTSAGIVNGSRTLKSGCRGTDVKFVQGKVGTTADGIFGDNTKARVITWQKGHKLTGDGLVGPLTWASFGVKYTGT